MADALLVSVAPAPGSRKADLLAASRRLFSERGYASTSMRDLAEALDMRPASLYSHYRSKEDILWEIALDCARAFHKRVLPLAEAGSPPGDRLAAMLKAHVEVIIEWRDSAAIFFREWKHLEGQRREQYAALIHDYETAFVQLIEEGIARGEFQPLDSHLSAYAMLSSANWIHRWYQPGKSLSPEAIGEHISSLILSGLVLSSNTSAT